MRAKTIDITPYGQEFEVGKAPENLKGYKVSALKFNQGMLEIWLKKGRQAAEIALYVPAGSVSYLDVLGEAVEEPPVRATLWAQIREVLDA